MTDKITKAKQYLAPGACVPIDMETTTLLIDALRQALDAANTNQQTITGGIAQPTVGHGARTGNDVADRKPTSSALRVGTEAGYGQPHSIGDIT